MNKLADNRALLSLLCAGILLIFFVMMHTPYFNIETDRASIQGIVWFPANHEEIQSVFAERIEDYNINQYIRVPLLLSLLSIASMILCVWKRGKLIAAIVITITAVYGLIEYISSPFLSLGNPYGVHITLLLMLLLLSGLYLSSFILGSRSANTTQNKIVP